MGWKWPGSFVARERLALLEKASADLTKVTEERDLLSRQLDVLHRHEREYGSWNERAEQLQLGNVLLETEREGLIKAIKGIRSAISDLETELGILENERDELQTCIDGAHHRLTTTIEELSLHSDAVAQTQLGLEQIFSALQHPEDQCISQGDIDETMDGQTEEESGPEFLEPPVHHITSVFPEPDVDGQEAKESEEGKIEDPIPQSFVDAQLASLAGPPSTWEDDEALPSRGEILTERDIEYARTVAEEKLAEQRASEEELIVPCGGCGADMTPQDGGGHKCLNCGTTTGCS